MSHASHPDIYSLSLHDALPILVAGTSAVSPPNALPPWRSLYRRPNLINARGTASSSATPVVSTRSIARRSEEHTSELQSPCNLVCRHLLEKKNFIAKNEHKLII